MLFRSAAHVAVVPFDVNTVLLDPILRRVALFEPLPMIKSPVVVIGDSALNAADAVVCPVPPLATGRAVPDKETASVPLVVMGDPDTDKNDGTVIATDETVPLEDAFEANSFTVPDAFLKYSFSSVVLRANSPADKFPALGVAEAVVL